MNELSVSIDNMLEEVAIAMTEGKNQRAKELLSKVIDSGDETQQLMAESYQMQLDLMIEMESNPGSDPLEQIFETSGIDQIISDELDSDEVMADFIEQEMPDSLIEESSNNTLVEIESEKITEFDRSAQSNAEVLASSSYIEDSHAKLADKNDDTTVNSRQIEKITDETPAQFNSSIITENNDSTFTADKEGVNVDERFPVNETETGENFINNILETENRSKDESILDSISSKSLSSEFSKNNIQEDTINIAEFEAPTKQMQAEKLENQNAFYDNNAQNSSAANNLIEENALFTKQSSPTEDAQEDFTSKYFSDNAPSNSHSIDKQRSEINDNLWSSEAASNRDVSLAHSGNESADRGLKPNDNSITQSQTSQNQEEIKIALEQVAMLVDEGELETADMLFKTIIGQSSTTQYEQFEAIVSDDISNKSPSNNEYKSDTLEHTTVNHSNDDVSQYNEQISAEQHHQEVKDSELSDNVITKYESQNIINQPLDTQNKSEHLVSSQDLQSSELSIATINSDERSERKDLLQPESDNIYELKSESAFASSPSTQLEHDGSKNTIQDVSSATESLLVPSAALESFTFDATSNTGEEKTNVLEQRQGFFVGGMGLMIKFADGNELMELPEYCKVPNSPNWMVGLTNLHGLVIPIFDLANFFNFESDRKKQVPMLLVLFSGDDAIGILIDSLPNRLLYSEDKKMSNNTTPSQLKEHVQSTYLISDNLWYDLDTKSLSNALEASMR